MSLAAEPSTAAALLVSPVRRGIVDVLARASAAREPEPMTAAQLAAEVGLHVSTVRFHLDQLVAAGLVDSEFRRQPGAGRPRKVYSLAPGSFGELAPRGEVESLRLLSGLLATTLADGLTDRAPTPAEAGRRWAREHIARVPGTSPAQTPGQWLARVAMMIDVLQGWGYTPEVATSGGGRTARVTLAHCPFLDLARSNPAVVCGIHRGLIAGSLEQLGESDTHVSLEPFVDATTCLAHVTTRTPFRPPAQKEPA